MEGLKSDSMDDRSFHLDNQVKSFRLYPPIRWKDVPLNLLLLALVVLLLTGFNFAASKLLNFLNRDALLVLVGLCVGFQLAVWIHRARRDSRASRAGNPAAAALNPISDRVRALASDPTRKIEAIKVYQEESGVGLAEAKSIVEALARDLKPR